MNNIDNLFKDELSSYAETPPPAVWDALEKRLDEKKRRGFPYRWLWYFTILSFIVMIGTSLAWKTSDTHELAATSPASTPIAETKLVTAPTVDPATEQKNTATPKQNRRPGSKKSANQQINNDHLQITDNTTAPVNTIDQPIAKTPEAETTNSTPAVATPAADNRPHKILVTNADGNGYTRSATAPKPAKQEEPVVAAANETKTYQTQQQTETDRTKGRITEVSTGEISESYERERDVAAAKEKAIEARKMMLAAAPEASHTQKSNIKAATHMAANKKSKASAPVTRQDNSGMHAVKETAENSTAAINPKHNHSKTAVAAVTTTNITNDEPKQPANKQAATNNKTVVTKTNHTAKKQVPATTDVPATMPVATTAPNQTPATAGKHASAKENTTQTTVNKSVATTEPAIAANEQHHATATPKSTVHKTKHSKQQSTNNEVPTPAANAAVNATAAIATENKSLTGKTTPKTEQAIAGKSAKKAPQQIADAKSKPVASKGTHKGKHTTPLAANTASTKEEKPAASIATKAVATSDNKPAIKSQKHTPNKVPATNSTNTATPAATTNDSGLPTAVKKKTDTKTPATVNVVAASATAAKTKTTGNKKATVKTSQSKTNTAQPATMPATTLPAETASAPADEPTSVDNRVTTAGNPMVKAGKKTKQPQAGKQEVAISKTKKTPAAPAVGNATAASGRKATRNNIPAQHGKAGKQAPATLPLASTGKIAATTPAPKPAVKTSKTNVKTVPGSVNEPETIEETSTPEAVAAAPAATTNEVAAAGKVPAIPGTFKPQPAAAVKGDAAPVKEDSTATASSTKKKFEFGMKGGFEMGLSNLAARKGVFSTYVAYNINPKWAVMLQPTIKAASLPTKTFGSSQSFYRQNGDSTSTVTGTTVVLVPTMGSGYDTLIRTDYHYSQSHDSLVKTSSVGGTYMEFELPVLLKYKLTSKLSVYGGLNIAYSKQIGISEHTQTINVLQTGETYALARVGQTPIAPTFGSVILPPGSPIAAYTGEQYQSPDAGLLRFGYMLGFSYEFRKRWMIDALMQQAKGKGNMQGGFDVNSALSLPYFRLTLGYKLTR